MCHHCWSTWHWSYFVWHPAQLLLNMSFSNFRLEQGKLRNQLGLDKAGKRSCAIGVVHILRHHGGGEGGLAHWWRLMTRGEGGTGTWWRHQTCFFNCFTMMVWIAQSGRLNRVTCQRSNFVIENIWVGGGEWHGLHFHWQQQQQGHVRTVLMDDMFSTGRVKIVSS